MGNNTCYGQPYDEYYEEFQNGNYWYDTNHEDDFDDDSVNDNNSWDDDNDDW